MRIVATLALLLFTLPVQAVVQWRGVDRSYAIHVPEKLPSNPVPLLLVLHGSGRDAKSMLRHWTALADANGFIVVAPQSRDPRQWQGPDDGPGFLWRVIEDVRAKHDIDDRRIYLFGHSAGAKFAILMACMESELFAAVAVHAGTLAPQHGAFADAIVRKIPIAFWSGDRDTAVPISSVRDTHALFVARGVPAELHELTRHDHNYDSIARRLNPEIWSFLSRHRLDAPPKYHKHADEP